MAESDVSANSNQSDSKRTPPTSLGFVISQTAFLQPKIWFKRTFSCMILYFTWDIVTPLKRNSALNPQLAHGILLPVASSVTGWTRAASSRRCCQQWNFRGGRLETYISGFMQDCVAIFLATTGLPKRLQMMTDRLTLIYRALTANSAIVLEDTMAALAGELRRSPEFLSIPAHKIYEDTEDRDDL
ncbi:hypothetical protein B0H19DRAFT_1070183 [Mycena capillaripes]|nr:hypothetical protein B0H19DRAFT_1070183 [Mycena capillaripes]